MAEQIHSISLIGNNTGYTLTQLSEELQFILDTSGNIYIPVEAYFQFIGWNKSLRKSGQWKTQLYAIATDDLAIRVEEITEIHAQTALGNQLVVLNQTTLALLHKLWAELNKRGLLSSKNFKWYIHSLQLQNWLNDPKINREIKKIAGWENYTYTQWKKVEKQLDEALPTNWASHLISFPEKVFEIALAQNEIEFPLSKEQAHQLALWFANTYYNRFSQKSEAVLDVKTKRRYNGLKRAKNTQLIVDLATEVEIITRLLQNENEPEIWEALAPVVRTINLENNVEKQKNQLPNLEKLLVK